MFIIVINVYFLHLFGLKKVKGQVEPEPKVEKGQLDQKVGEKQERKVSSGASRNLWQGSSSFATSESACNVADPFTSMFLLT